MLEFEDWEELELVLDAVMIADEANNDVRHLGRESSIRRKNTALESTSLRVVSCKSVDSSLVKIIINQIKVFIPVTVCVHCTINWANCRNI